MIKLTKKQKKLLLSIVERDNNWDASYDQLFVDIIPLIYSLTRKNCKFGNFFQFESNDFLSYGFIVYTKTIDQICTKKKDINCFVDLYISNFRDYVRSLRKQLWNNSNKVLNQCESYDDDLLDNKFKDNDDSSVMIKEFYLKIFKLINKNKFLLNYLRLKFEGYSNYEIASKMNITFRELNKRIEIHRQWFNEI